MRARHLLPLLAVTACTTLPPAPPPRPAPLAAVPAPRPIAARSPAPPAAPAPAAPALEPRLRQPTAWSGAPDLPADERARLAIETRRPVVERLFAAASVPFPPAELLFRAFKQERQLEVWAGGRTGAPLVLVATYGICGMSGDLGPKRREGDHQVPEGFYKIQYLWPESNYHLEMKIGYPNDLDRHLSDHVPEGPGGNIMIHGTCASVGCLAMSDERVEELWTMASAVHGGDRRVHVHIFPGRDIPALLRDPQNEPHRRFWENLQEGFARFEKDHRLFQVEADWHARYLFR